METDFDDYVQVFDVVSGRNDYSVQILTVQPSMLTEAYSLHHLKFVIDFHSTRGGSVLQLE